MQRRETAPIDQSFRTSMLPILDPVTALAGVVAGKVLNAVIWSILALLRPRLAGPKLIVIGSLTGALGFLRIGMRGPSPSAAYLTADECAGPRRHHPDRRRLSRTDAPAAQSPGSDPSASRS